MRIPHHARGPIWLALVAGTALIPGSLLPQPRNAFAAGKLPDVQTIQAALDDHADSIKTIAGRFRRTVLSHEKRVPNASRFEDQVNASEFAASFEHACSAIEQLESWVFRDVSSERWAVRRLNRFDGQRGYNLVYTNKEAPFLEVGPPPDLPYRLGMNLADGTVDYYMPQDFIGLRLRSLDGRSLAAFARSAAVKVEAEETIDGAKCVLVSMAQERNRVRVRAWLDSALAFMPRRIQTFRKVADEIKKVVDEFAMQDDLESFDFRRCPLGGGHGEIWMPFRLHVRNWALIENTLDVEELSLNVALPITRFQVDPAELPEGVQIDDGTGRLWVTGNRDDLFKERYLLNTAFSNRCNEERAKNREEQQPQEQREQAAPVTAVSPEPSQWPWQVALIVSVVVIAIGARLVAKARGRS